MACARTSSFASEDNPAQAAAATYDPRRTFTHLVAAVSAPRSTGPGTAFLKATATIGTAWAAAASAEPIRGAKDIGDGLMVLEETMRQRDIYATHRRELSTAGSTGIERRRVAYS